MPERKQEEKRLRNATAHGRMYLRMAAGDDPMSKVIFGQLGLLKPEKIEEYEALHAKTCFVKFGIRPDSEFYADMKQIFYYA